MNSFKPSAASMVAAVVNEETGEERKRLINKGRWKGYGPATVTFGDLNVSCFPGSLIFGLRSIGPRKSNSCRATSPKSSQTGAPRTRHAGRTGPSNSPDSVTDAPISSCKTVQSGRVLPCIINSVLPKSERYTSEVSLFTLHINSRPAAQRSCSLLFAIRSRTGPGGIHLSA